MILGDPSWDYRMIDFDTHVALADRSDIARVSASNANVSDYVRRGGKLILSGGWNNALVPAGAVVDYYTRVRSTIGAPDTDRSVRLYMVPGMIECNGGPGTDTFDMLGVMRRWVERGEAPTDVHGIARRARKSGTHASALPVSSSRDVQRQRKHGRREKLHLQIGRFELTERGRT